MPSYSSHLLCCQSAQRRTLLLDTCKRNHVHSRLYSLHVHLLLAGYALPHHDDKTFCERQESWLHHVTAALFQLMMPNKSTEPRQLSSLH